jgi:hypothetical protein
MKPAIKNDGTHACVGIVVLVAIFMVLFTAVLPGQELPNAPQAAVKHQIPPVQKERSLLAKPDNPALGSADWFRERGLLKLARFMPVLTHIHCDLSYDKPKDAAHDSRRSK